MPVPNCLDKTYQLALVCGEFVMERHEWLAKECQGSHILMNDHIKASARRVAFDDEGMVEREELQHWCSREGILSALKA